MITSLTVSFVQRLWHGDRDGVVCCRIDRRRAETLDLTEFQRLAEALKSLKDEGVPLIASGGNGA